MRNGRNTPLVAVGADSGRNADGVPREVTERTHAYRTLETLVYEGVRDAIVARRYVPGQALVASRLARELGVSRAPVGAALKRLRAEGFVDGDPHKVLTVTTLSPARIREVYAIRSALEALAARGAVQHASHEQVTALAHLADDIARSISDASRVDELDARFHQSLHEASGMPIVCAMLDNLYDRCEFYRALAPCDVDGANYTQSLAEHGAMVVALRNRDAAEAERLLTRHLARSLERILGVVTMVQNAYSVEKD